MSDSPAVSVPQDPNETPILDALLNIRTELELLRHDKSQHIKSQDIIPHYEKVIKQVKILNEIRREKRYEQNRVDHILDDCFRLISLSFLASGKTCEPPAVYAAVSTIKRLLDHLKEAAFFCRGDLDGISKTLKRYRRCCAEGEDSHDAELIILLDARLDICQETLDDLYLSLSNLTPEDSKCYSTLVSILRSLSNLNTKKTFPKKEVDAFVSQLKEIEENMKVEHKVDTTGRSYEEIYSTILTENREKEQKCGPRPADALINELLYRCFLWAEIITARQGKIDERFQEPYEKLVNVRNKLENLVLCSTWSIRETDLYGYQRTLDKYDDTRVNGNFVDANGNPADLHAQRTLLYLIRKSYALIYHLIVSSEPVSSALLPVYNQLKTLKDCLIQVGKAGGVSSPQELYPYSMKLNSIENTRVDGKFMVNGDAPDGQEALDALVKECVKLATDLRDGAKTEEESQTPSAPSLETREPTAVN
ncbi:hypothetical protein EJ05DRAFT_304938 [Pseudovirgaria hyperparasitica]|uniref:Uncharacterized protein n=1 Tax=Pseudovirgaria hyperparasitica TaxID=470096 RepID=A0A6A6WCF2_9PEZI|nr:uncharacterized protein EJ05DRAFT_304938 [Pseudovirgaria hyperparasitica]KAF2759640.1 hypothetical protein EJ05DRAFT_304938 [Pseudovirgaria hyperparasitica]